MPGDFNLITVLGPTASGKTSLAAKLAHVLNTDIISADSRQVYRGMDLGTGKDYEDYIIAGEKVTTHLLDIVEAGYKYNVYEYQKDFLHVFNHIRNQGKLPILCGGTGMYLEAVLKGYRLIAVPDNKILREELKDIKTDKLIERLKSYKQPHNTTDVTQRKRLIRAIEIEEYYSNNQDLVTDYPDIVPIIIGVKIDRDSRRKRISDRLQSRFNEGMVEEVRNLLESGVDPDTLIYYGLEYKYITLYLKGELTYDQMFKKLESAIHQFAKRQMTWFRGMERRGFKITWIDWALPDDEKVKDILSKFNLHT